MGYRSRITFRLAFATLSVVTLLSLTSAADEKGDVNLSFNVRHDRPLLVEVDRTFDGYLSIVGNGFEWEDDWVSTDKLVFIDTHAKRKKGERERATRHFVQHKGTYNKEISDTALNGVTARIVDDGESWDIKLTNDRVLSGELFDDLIAMAPSLGAWLKFPDGKFLQETISVDFSPLSNLLVGSNGVERSTAELRIGSHDPITKRSELKGKLELKGSVNIAETAAEIEMKGKLEIVVLPAESRIESVNLDVEWTLSGGEQIDIRGGGKCTSILTTEVDEKKIKKQKKRKPKFRTRKVRIPRMGVGIKLPSHWTLIHNEGQERVWARTLESKKGNARLELKMIEGNSAYQPALEMDKIYASLKQTYPDLTYKKTRNPLGTGEARAYSIPKGKSGGDNFYAELYPWRGKFLMLRLVGEGRCFGNAYKEIQAAKKSLGILKPKRTK